jgi:hypothetical protein
MNLNFVAALAALGEGAAFRIANEARPMSDYVFNTLLPEQNRPTFHVSSGGMTVRATMAGLVSMDSPYPPGGLVESSEFAENTAKVANEVFLTEQALRHLQDWMLRTGRGGAGSPEALAQEALNFLDKVIIQPHLDTAEWLRGQALVHGEIVWEFGGKRLDVNYGVPAANFLPTRTGAEAYGAAGSVFWQDIVRLRRALRGNVRAIIAHSETIDAIRYNEANAMATVAEGGNSITFRRFVRNTETNQAITGQFSPDTGDNVTLIAYDREGEMLNPADPTTTIILPFMPRGKLLAIGNNTRSGYIVGQGSTDTPDDEGLGYTHIAPTVEGGRPGRWAELYTPERMPWQLNGRGVTNLLPVIEAPAKIAVATTELA